MNTSAGSPFDSIESAHDFVKILSAVVAETKQEIDEDIKRESDLKVPRRLDALRVASYSLEKLDAHMIKSCRLLNDLRSLRRLLFEERKFASAAKTVKPAAPVVAQSPSAQVAPLAAAITRSSAVSERVAIA